MDSPHKREEFAKKNQIRQRNGREGTRLAVHVCLCENESIFNIVCAGEGDGDGVVPRNGISLLIPHLHG